MRIIPAIDIIDGQCVRLSKGDYNTSKVYNTSPVEVAKQFEDAGIKYLHVVDLDGAKSSQIMNAKVLEEIATQTNLQIDFGGGIKNDSDIITAFNSGAKQVTVGSIAATKPELFLTWLERYGSEQIILGADCKQRKIMTQGWLDSADTDVLEFIQSYEQRGVSYTIVTDIEKDGMLNGPAIELYKEIITNTEVKLIASGGLTTVAELYKLKEIGCEGVIIGKAIYEGRITLKELSELC
ncbi:1-(5-phosphoribosyl)-5-[(5-phosphoribosylamino)methylideneamino]imidazole-4-carboxamide isomerase [Myroides odoratimimus]|uniref:1-(5-phosphoribosyl)-5-[(5-phosphoribosylamino)methylideneamino] imidazole-4-carboxamide isomerase n=2 Tax=Myroides odoratimimus TaxID=76832 RepID=A0AAI8C7Y1_9FLAO|nr:MULTISPECIES: 1-(5-phosphoribosyl)-5-[(5-phosphoribosylamino)methylideneamino]imidazole-4-carboxamide isomerase [Myroides]AJA70826.1 1-(5-phosphoribosyl)-5-[(5-phosphoribosylamino)methylideneamino] imidazole-4-carboxamide isomerase [Myroides sp. A21]ALU27596.1 1-(5-phosphoribosyl)-5-((5-phosphoribosylamino)methylideneamino)imidazole-4-carboxamide isomerase [Myroides odoratimimus]EHO07510.1 1-(5-phosphoribosyl)-5-[(5-phosphoribosylamino)methylideneamino]imidazole-4-carboxamide isomerase [Myroi